MNRHTFMAGLTLLGGALLSSGADARTTAFTDSSNRVIIQQVIAFTFSQNYDQALTAAASLDSSLSDHPAGPLLKAGVLYCRMLDFEDALDMAEFDRYYADAWQKSEALKKQGEPAEGDLYLGVLLGFKALLQQRRGQWWPAIKFGMKSVGRLKDCLKKDSTYADALLGIGTYQYWRSRATDFINWLPLISDRKLEGIAMVRRAVEGGLFGKEISRSTLAWILIDAGRPSEAISLSLEGLKLFPHSRFYLWTLADGYYHTRQWKKAAAIYQKLYDSIHGETRNNLFNEVGLCKQMARCHQNMKKPEMALDWVRRGLSLPLSGDAKERRKKDMERLNALQTSLEKQLVEAKQEKAQQP